MKRIIKPLYKALPFKKQAFSFVRFFGSPPERIYKHLHFKGVFTVDIDRERSFRLRHHGFRIENEIFWEGLEGGWEKVSFELWAKLSQRSNVILDIGANTGIFSLIAGAMNPNTRIFAFEPVQRVFEKLEDNNKLNGSRITCIRKAVSNNDGKAVIYDTQAEHILSVTVNQNLNSEGTSVVPVEIETMRLSTFIRQNDLDRIDLMKIDVETHEPEALEGMEEYLDKFRPVILIEILNEDIAQRVEKLVRDKDYLYFNIDERKGARQAETITTSDYYNYLLCNRATAADLGIL